MSTSSAVFKWLPTLVALLAASGARAQPAMQSQVDIEEHLGAQVPMELALTDQDGRPVTLGDYFHDGKPVLLVLAYYRCTMLCDLVLHGVVESTTRQGLTLGRDYRVLTVSFDPLDTPAAALSRQHGMLQGLNFPEAKDAWPFLVGNPRATRALADAVGFRYARDEATGQYAHPASVFILTPEGVISRYLYGARFRPLDVRLALDEAARGGIGRIVDRVLLTCFRYDPASRRYSVYVAGILRTGATLTLVLLGALFFFVTRRSRGAPPRELR
jgi:protein SCO1/2